MRHVTLQFRINLGKQKSNLSVDQLSQALELTSEEDTTKKSKKYYKELFLLEIQTQSKLCDLEWIFLR